nr:ROK family protein [Izhakiella australiensis]
MQYLGLDVGGSKIAAVVMDEHGREFGRFRCATQKRTRQQFVATIVDFIADIRARIGQPLTTGIALPGSISPHTGTIRNANIQVINVYRLQDALQQRLGQRVVLANDGNCFALSEACDGAGAGYGLVFTDSFTTPIISACHGDSSGMRGAAWLAVRSGG